ncbi:Tol-Pal system protein TolB (plasmid) [Pseudoseohaeicola sp. NH-UV-7]|uniref:TolB family protein n=1 Tax=Sulfitobacter sp. TBRI5 TaxID=2989732 RepID=UPI003A714B7F
MPTPVNAGPKDFRSGVIPMIAIFFVTLLLLCLNAPVIAEEAPIVDPNRIVVSLLQNGQWDLHTSRFDGTNRKQLTNDDLREINPLWSPNGKFLAFSHGVPLGAGVSVGGDGLFVIREDGSGLRTISSDRVIAPSFSPDSRLVSYFTGQEPWVWFFCSYEKFELHIVDIESGREIIHVPNLIHATWLNANGTVLWLDQEGNFGVTDPIGGETRALADPPESEWSEWPFSMWPLVSSTDGSHIYWLATSIDRDVSSFRQTNSEGGEIRELFALPSGLARLLISDYWGCYAPRRLVADWSPSGSKLLLTKLAPMTPQTEFPNSDLLNYEIGMFNLSIVEITETETSAKDIPYTTLLVQPVHLEGKRSVAKTREELGGEIRESTIGIADAYWSPDGKSIIYAIEWGGKWSLLSYEIETGRKTHLFPQIDPSNIAFLGCCGW